MKNIHSLLKRQINKHLGESSSLPKELNDIFDAINNAYIQSDIDREMLERSIDLSSQELLQSNSEMKAFISLLNATIESTADGILVVDREGKIVSFNKKFIEMWHIPESIVELRDDEKVLAFVVDQLRDPEGFIKKVRELYAEPHADSYDMLEFKDGRVFERYSQPQKIEEVIVGRVWSFRDVTEHKKADEDLKASEERFRAISNTAYDAILVMNEDGKIIYWNTSAERMFGYKNEEAIGKDLHLLLAPERYYENYKKGFGRFQKTGQGPAIKSTLEFNAIRKDRTEFPIEVSTSAIKINEQWCAVGIVRDITERKRAAEKLQASEAELHDNYFAQSAINGILSESLEDIPLEEFLQKALNMILSIPWIAFEAIGSISLVEDNADALIMKAQSNIPEPLKEFCLRVPFGKCFCGKAAQDQEIQFADHIDARHEICYEGMVPHGHYSVPILSGGRTLGVLNIYLKEGHTRNQKEEEFLNTVANTLAGIIERKKVEQDRARLQSQLLQAQKMEAIGTLAGGVAHDFNNLLMGILGYTSLMLMKTEKTHPFHEKLKIIEQQVQSGTELTRQLLGFAHGGKYEVKPVNVNDLIIKTSDIFGRTKKEVTIHKKLQEDLHSIEADTGQIERVFFNLYVNAWQAMPSGGALYLETQDTILHEQQSRPFNLNPGQYVKISVTDTGVGMDSETRKRIFEPFFSTKGIGKGTGLGLASAYGIIRNHGGMINVYSEKGHGTTFTIYLPASMKEAVDTKPAEESLLTGDETILVVDDEKINVELMKELLEKLGYKILTAQSGKKALELYRKHSKDIKLVILDMIMPKMNGKEVLVKLMEIDKKIRVLLSSGYSIDGEAAEILEMGCRGFIQKPFRVEELSRKIRTVLDCGDS